MVAGGLRISLNFAAGSSLKDQVEVTDGETLWQLHNAR